MERYQFDPAQQAAMEASPIPFAVYQFIDKRVVTIALSAGFLELFGYDDLKKAYYVMDNDMYCMDHPDDVARIADEAIRFATEGGEYNVAYRTKMKDTGLYHIIHARGKHVYTETGVRLAYVWYTDEGIYEGSPEKDAGADSLSRSFSRILREGSMVRDNRYDSLTALPNMTYFFELAETGIGKLKAEGKVAVILFLDLCGMKGFNSRWGFAEGDKLIRSFAHLLAHHFGSENSARFAQDHFAAFAEAEGIHKKLDALIADWEKGGSDKILPVRIGVYPVEGEEIEIGLSCDRAKMACDMNAGSLVSGYRFFDEKLLEQSQKKQYVIDNLDRALTERWIKVYHQPIVRAANGRVCDEEALARWDDPVQGLLSPADFIPALEESGLIYRLDLYVVDRILEKMHMQAEEGLYVVPESVNLSRKDFESCDIVEEIRRRVDEAGIARSLLTIEITESIIGSDFDFMKTQVERFRELGFQVWMDDFGSGYSSLDVLQDIHFDLIKFDMHFMQRLDSGPGGRVILAELIKMAISLGVETICEGVETAEQVEFLQEIGCTKLQGFYYCRPIPLETILERYRTGTQIGFENPAESEYYTTIGQINLYDMAAFSGDSKEDEETLGRYFNTLPMAIMEVKGSHTKYTRCNKSYREFSKRMFGTDFLNREFDYDQMPNVPGSAFMTAVITCGKTGARTVIDERVSEDTTVHALIKQVAVNPVNGTSAVAVAVLAVVKDSDSPGTTFAHIAKALSSDYLSLYYVDLETDKFTEYTSDAIRENLAVERHGEDFFAQSRKDALKALDKQDQAYFISSFTKEQILRNLDRQGNFTLTYRLLIDGEPVYVNMKGTRMQADDSHIIIGVSNVDAQMRRKEEMERIRAEQTTYARIMALAGDFICIYTVDPETSRYLEYSASKEYEGLGFAKGGEDFFTRAREDGARTAFEEDRKLFDTMFTRENVMREIENGGLYALKYRLVMDGQPVYVNLKAALVQEQDGPQLIIGLNNINDQVLREQDLEHKLFSARSRANLDTLTGVKNRTAYDNMSEDLTRQIEHGEAVRYGIVLCRVSGLEQTNEDRGWDAGDDLIREACGIICTTFKHSPVFRVGGDEFAVICRGHDYEHIDELVEEIAKSNRRNRESGGALIACGMSKYDGIRGVAAVFARAEGKCRKSEV